MKVFIGLAIGCAVSAVVWMSFWEQLNWVLLVAVIGAKLVAAVACAHVPGWRPVAEGLVVSIGIGALIFIGICAAGVNG